MRRFCLALPVLAFFLLPSFVDPVSARPRPRHKVEAGKRKGAAASPRSAAPASSATSGGPAASAEAAELLAEVDDITRQVVALRGLAARKPIARGTLDRERIGAKLRERIDKEYTPEEVELEARVLKRLGLLPPEVDYPKLLTALLMEQVAGFYDPYAGELYIADWLPSGLQRPALAHEIEHALQDQHFDLKKFATPLKDDGDRQLARSALVEGDGTAVMLEFVAQSMNADVNRFPEMIEAIAARFSGGASEGGLPDDGTQLAKAPRYLRETLTFPYFAGMRFVFALRKGQPWSRIDDVFKDPPESTEQVIHPEKYLARERPVEVTTTSLAALAPGKELRRDVIGEFTWSLLLANQIDEAQARRAAEGWGGDRMVTYGQDEGPVGLVSLSSWDSETDAIEMEGALRLWMSKTLGQPQPAAGAPAVFTRGGESWSVERRGQKVLAIFGVAAASRDAAVAEVWKSWKVAGARAGHL